MRTVKPATWIDYIKDTEKQTQLSNYTDLSSIQSFIIAREQAHSMLLHSLPMVYLLDYRTGKYLFVSKQCEGHLGLSHQGLLQDGTEYVIERYQPDDLKLFNKQIFPDRLKILALIPPEEHKHYSFSFNYRIKNMKGEYINIIQRNSFIESDKNGNPLLSLGVINNVNDFAPTNPVIQLLEKVNYETGTVDLVKKQTYYLNEEDKIFSKREKEMLHLLADGFTSKGIADKLSISEHTVIQHKRNMQNKSNTPNTVGLVQFAVKKGLL